MPWSTYNSSGVLQVTPPEDVLPVGSVVMYAHLSGGAPTLPTKWLLCDGSSSASKVTYPDLWALIGTTYGPDAGGPTGTFTLPNFSTAFPSGASITRPPGSRDVSAQRTHHNHTGQSNIPHNHRFTTDHTHGVPAHRHSLRAHDHQEYHRHGVGSLTVDAALPTALGDSGVGVTVATAGHTHGLTGTVGESENIAGFPGLRSVLPSPGYTGYHPATSTGSIQWETGTRSTAAAYLTVQTPSEIVSPYLNMYFIIKAL